MSTSNSEPGLVDAKDGDTMPSDDGGKNPGEALSKFDFSQIDPGSHTDPGSNTDLAPQGPDHSDVHAALASMSSEDALDYAISHMGGVAHLDSGHVDAAGHVDAGNFDVGHFDMPDTSHDA
jgi:hypothetical protein